MPGRRCEPPSHQEAEKLRPPQTMTTPQQLKLEPQLDYSVALGLDPTSSPLDLAFLSNRKTKSHDAMMLQ